MEVLVLVEVEQQLQEEVQTQAVAEVDHHLLSEVALVVKELL
jgi:hypothetical protein